MDKVYTWSDVGHFGGHFSSFHCQYLCWLSVPIGTFCDYEHEISIRERQSYTRTAINLVHISHKHFVFMKTHYHSKHQYNFTISFGTIESLCLTVIVLLISVTMFYQFTNGFNDGSLVNTSSTSRIRLAHKSQYNTSLIKACLESVHYGISQAEPCSSPLLQV